MVEGDKLNNCWGKWVEIKTSFTLLAWMCVAGSWHCKGKPFEHMSHILQNKIPKIVTIHYFPLVPKSGLRGSGLSREVQTFLSTASSSSSSGRIPRPDERHSLSSSPGSFLRSPSSQTWGTYQMPELPQLAPLDVDELWLYWVSPG